MRAMSTESDQQPVFEVENTTAVYQSCLQGNMEKQQNDHLARQDSMISVNPTKHLQIKPNDHNNNISIFGSHSVINLAPLKKLNTQSNDVYGSASTRIHQGSQQSTLSNRQQEYLNRSQSQKSVQNSSYSNIKLHNKSILEQQKNHPFESCDIGEELINKPTQRLGRLENAQSLKMYINPNYKDENLARAKSFKLIPMYQSKTYNKLRSILPCIQNIQPSLIAE